MDSPRRPLQSVVMTWWENRYCKNVVAVAVVAFIVGIIFLAAFSTGTLPGHWSQNSSSSIETSTHLTNINISADHQEMTALHQTPSTTLSPASTTETPEKPDIESKRVEIRVKMLKDLSELNRLLKQPITPSAEFQQTSATKSTNATTTASTPKQQTSSADESSVTTIASSQTPGEILSPPKLNKWNQMLDEVLAPLND